MITSILQQSLYPSLVALGTSVNFEEKQRKALEDTVEGTFRSTNTSPTSEVEEQAEEVIVPGVNSQARTTQADT